MNYFCKVKLRIQKLKSNLCIGIDPDRDKLSRIEINSEEALYEYLQEFIVRTAPYAAAYKPNIAFFEGWGPAGWEIFQEIRNLVPSEIAVIADAKRNDIGSSSHWYARAFFDIYGIDAITVNPLLGTDSLMPFIEREAKGVYVLCLTSNPGSNDFQLPFLYLDIARWCSRNNQHGNIGMVVGATQKKFQELAEQSSCPFLIPGIGSQGGKEDMVKQCLRLRALPDLVNVSRDIMFPDCKPEYYWEQVEKAARSYNEKLTSRESEA